MIANDRNRVRWLVLGLSQDGAFVDLYENHSENSLKGDLSNDTTVSPPLFSLVNTFKIYFCEGWVGVDVGSHLQHEGGHHQAAQQGGGDEVRLSK